MSNILFISVNDHVPWGGSEELWSQVARKLTNTVHVDVLIKKWPNPHISIAKLQEAGAKIYYKETQRYQNKSLLNRFLIKAKIKKLDEQNHFYDSVNFSKYNLVVICLGNHLDPLLISYYDRVEKLQVPFIIINQLITDLRNINDKIASSFRLPYLSAKAIYVLSEDNKMKLELQLSECFNNIEFIDNPFNYSQSYQKLKRVGDYYSIACVAALTTFHKGQDLLIKVLSHPKWKERKLQLNLYGEGQNKEQLSRLINMYNLQETVHLRGHVQNKEDIWLYNSLCILPSRMEGQSLVMLEAMSCGRAVISTNVGDAKRLIIEGETGFIIESATVECIDKVLELAWTQRNRWEEMGKIARSSLFEIITEDPVTFLSKKLLKLI